MVPCPRCPPGAGGLLALLLLLLPVPGARASCGVPPRLKSAVLIQKDADKSSYPIGTHVSYDCRPGYESTETTRNITCLESGKWSEAPEFCRGKSCHALELLNGRMDVTSLQFGATANFYCNVGYRLIGPTSVQCVLVGNGVDWDKEVPFCEASCDAPPKFKSAVLIPKDADKIFYPFGAHVSYVCRSGYESTEATHNITCLENRTWSEAPNFCRVSGTDTDTCTGIGIGILIGVVIVCICVGICVACNKKHQKKKGTNVC